MSDSSDREVVSTRLFKFPRERVFQAWTDPQELAQWWGPAGFSNTFDEFDLRPGGHWRFTMHGPDGKDTFLELNPPSLLSFDHVNGPHFRATITFTEEAGGTRVLWKMLFDTVTEYEALKGLIVGANEQNLDRLEASLAR